MGTSVGYEYLNTRSEIILKLFKEFQFQFFYIDQKSNMTATKELNIDTYGKYMQTGCLRKMYAMHI